jgi:DnaJ-class molecular chaperone
MKRDFDPERYGMIVCPSCIGSDFIQNPEHQCCPTCGGFGFIRKEEEQELKERVFEKGNDDGNQVLSPERAS